MKIKENEITMSTTVDDDGNRSLWLEIYTMRTEALWVYSIFFFLIKGPTQNPLKKDAHSCSLVFMAGVMQAVPCSLQITGL